MTEGENRVPDIQKILDLFDASVTTSPNCIGYTLYSLGLETEEKNIDPQSQALDDLVQERFERADSPQEADAIAVIYNREATDAGKILREYAHMAVVNKQKPGYATERRFSVAKIQETPIQNIWSQYPPKTYGSPPEYTYLKLKPLIKE